MSSLHLHLGQQNVGSLHWIVKSERVSLPQVYQALSLSTHRAIIVSIQLCLKSALSSLLEAAHSAFGASFRFQLPLLLPVLCWANHLISLYPKFFHL